MCTHVYLMVSPCDVSAWDILARFVANCGGGYTLNSYHPLMSMASSSLGFDGALEECSVVSIDTYRRTHDYAMYGFIYKPTRSDDRYRVVPLDLVSFGEPRVHMSSFVQSPTILDVFDDNIIPQNARHVRSLPDSDKWLVAEDGEMESIRHNKMIAPTVRFLPDGIITITTMFIYALKRTLINTIERYKARWVVRGSMEIPDVHFDPDAAHTPVTSNSSILVMISLVVKHYLHFKHLDAKRLSSTLHLHTKFGSCSMLAMSTPLGIHVRIYANRCMAHDRPR